MVVVPLHSLYCSAAARDHRIIQMSSARDQLLIRNATLRDMPAITEIYRDAVLNTVATMDTEPPTIETRTEWFRGHGGRYPVLVGQVQGEVVGWALLSVWIGRGACRYTAEASVYVSVPQQRHGTGTVLLSFLVERARDLNHHVLIANVTQGKATSLELVRRLRFQEVGITREVACKFGRWLDMWVLQLMLPYPPGTGHSA